MINLFDWIDTQNVKFNIFREHKYLQKVALLFVGLALIFWVLLGYDSGVGIMERAVATLPKLATGQVTLKQWVDFSYEIYGRSFHWSAFVIYGLLYVGLSEHLSFLGLKQSRNILYSASLVMLNIAVFEWWYMSSFAIIQMNRTLLQTFISDFIFLQQYLWILLLGIVAVIGVWVESHILNDKKVVGRLFTWKPEAFMLTAVAVTLLAITLWYYYPFPVETVMVDDWTSSRIFPQTHYAYKDSTLYIRNDLLHTVNLFAKAMFAVTQIMFFWGYKRVHHSPKIIE